MMSTEPWNAREALTAMIFELRANRVILAGLTDRYGVFLFTGGAVSRDRWSLDAITSFLDSRFAADRISPGEVERYRQLAEKIMELGQAVAAGGPRALRSRQDIAETFGRASAEIRRLGSALESAMVKSVEAAERPSALVEMAAGAAEMRFSAMDRVGTTSGGDQ